ncbi:hypothetical protein PPL_10671 [Heterostelium album PN500]|uniref:G8 domain-containing protein n=1 Tax=Heterostelium pallidum (strain ATCC 26659 / Pp 5 / PN500) TaxID=670386 RepID=D3BRR0_HETP5|nr:hypothetical protein PPL_10671 [Heterostelium album PN500]EFA76092.1 hypothetical protein PPL_10671 [Heterostelium album PN500]|eukprot:XP_020428226.1 hypothetical protein PPL_10671 [Heterostelium album PN500]
MYFYAQSCPSTATAWRPTMASATPPSSPPITITASPAVSTLYDESNLIFMAQYGYSATSLTDGPSGVVNSFTINYPTWGPEYHYLVSKTPTPALKSGVSYQFSFNFKLGQVYGTYNRVSSMTLYLFRPDDITDPNGSSQYFTTSSGTPLLEKTFTGSFTSSTSFVANSVTIIPTTDIGESVLALKIQRTTQTGPVVTTIFISEMKLTIPSQPIVPPSTLLTKDSELVNIPKPPLSAIDIQDPASCPYAATNLVHWHDPTIWSGGVVPAPNTATITLPVNKRVLLSPCSISQTAVYQKIVIPATSELIFSDAAMTWNVKDIYVQGRFTMGTRSCRYNANINIVFHGARTTASTIATNFGSKGIAVASTGFISVQGKQYHQTWTKLAATAWSGDCIIYVQDDVNWEVGQQIVITTSIYKDNLRNQNEIMTIAAIEGKKIQLTTSLRYYHYGGQEYQAEVGLLSRRLVFRGDGNSSNTDSDQFGGHILVNSNGQFSGLQLIKMGQKNIKGRYPLHFHMAGTVTNSYISDCSVLDSYYRCYTIHGTNNLTLTRNVAFNAIGHCYYLEDGVEMDNLLSFNLAARIQTIGQPAAGSTQYGDDFTESDSLKQPADVTASGFYISNAWNSFIGNAASGGWASFSFPYLERPVGNFLTSPIVPFQYPLKEFNGNTAHSSGYYFEFGSSIYVGGKLTYDDSDGLLYYTNGRVSRETYSNGVENDANIVWMTFNNTKVYLSNRGIGMWGERSEANALESHDSRRPASLFGESWVNNALVNGQSANLLAKGNEVSRQGFQFYDTYVKTILTNVVFRNYATVYPYSQSSEDDNKVIISMTHSDEFKPQGISATRNITLQNCLASQIIGHNIVDTGSSRYFNFIDFDGTVTGRAGVPTIVGAHDKWWQFDSSCVYNSAWNSWVCDKGSREIANVQFWVPGLISRDESWPANSYVGYTYLFGNGISDVRRTVATRNAGVTGISNAGWYLYLTAGSPTYMKIWLSQVVYSNYVFLAVRYPASTTFSVSCEYKYNSQYSYNFTMAASPSAVRNGNGKTYHFDGTHLFVKLVNFRLDGSEYFSRGGAKIFDVYWEFLVHINAKNTVTPPVNGFFTGLSDVLPSSTL